MGKEQETKGQENETQPTGGKEKDKTKERQEKARTNKGTVEHLTNPVNHMGRNDFPKGGPPRRLSLRRRSSRDNQQLRKNSPLPHQWQKSVGMMAPGGLQKMMGDGTPSLIKVDGA